MPLVPFSAVDAYHQIAQTFARMIANSDPALKLIRILINHLCPHEQENTHTKRLRITASRVAQGLVVRQQIKDAKVEDYI